MGVTSGSCHATAAVGAFGGENRLCDLSGAGGAGRHGGGGTARESAQGTEKVFRRQDGLLPVPGGGAQRREGRQGKFRHPRPRDAAGSGADDRDHRVQDAARKAQSTPDVSSRRGVRPCAAAGGGAGPGVATRRRHAAHRTQVRRRPPGPPPRPLQEKEGRARAQRLSLQGQEEEAGGRRRRDVAPARTRHGRRQRLCPTPRHGRPRTQLTWAPIVWVCRRAQRRPSAASLAPGAAPA
mmetsp:Transcript_23789/g.47785  ORF Transcript_23789/g.47785 Transcript_23789/m.47785 type:complete len:238 (-) Transcript_23789:237-950(-)